LIGACASLALHALAQSERGNLRLDQTTRPDGTLDLTMLWSRGQAVGKGPVHFTHSPMRVEDIERFVPYGMMIGGHVCPIDHGYFYPKPVRACQPHFDVMSPADGHIVMISHRTQLTGSTEQRRDYDDYALHIEDSATFYTFYDLLTQLDPAISRQLDNATRDPVAPQLGHSPGNGLAYADDRHPNRPARAGSVSHRHGELASRRAQER
jgi:hypothetical protein